MKGLQLLDPWLLLLGLPFLLAAWWRWRAPRPATVLFPTLKTVPRVRTWRVRLLRLPALLFALAIGCLLLALARPRRGEARSLIRREGIAISMVLDRSASMDEPVDAKGVYRVAGRWRPPPPRPPGRAATARSCPRAR